MIRENSLPWATVNGMRGSKYGRPKTLYASGICSTHVLEMFSPSESEASEIKPYKCGLARTYCKYKHS